MESGRTADVTEQVESFMAALPMFPGQPTKSIIEAVDYVVAEGPSARRPVLGEISLEPDYREYIPVFGNHLREIRPLGTNVRILCIFGPDRTLVLLHAGDKTGEWNSWYATAIKEASRSYLEYLRETGQH